MEIREEAGDYHRILASTATKGSYSSREHSNSKPLILSISLRDSTSVDSSLSKDLAMKRNPPNERILDELRPMCKHSMPIFI